MFACSVAIRMSTHISFKVLAVISNCLGLLPIGGVTSNAPHDLHFSWKSPKMLYCFLILAAKLVFIILVLLNPLTHKSAYQKASKYCLKLRLKVFALSPSYCSRLWFSSNLHIVVTTVHQCVEEMV